MSSFNTENVTDMSYMFASCNEVRNFDVSNFNTGNVTNMRQMFYGCSNLESVNVSGLNTENVTDMYEMFGYNYNLKSLDLSSFNTENVTDMSNMFSYNYHMTTIYAGRGWSTASITSADNMFRGCSQLVGGMGTAFDSNHTGAEYARLDGGPNKPGYLTAHPMNGDLNGDCYMNITDVTTLIDYLLSSDPSGVNLQYADVNGDGAVNISDVTTLIDMLLNGGGN